MNDLSSRGLYVAHNNKQRVLYFQLGLIKGDNLGLNKILGFTENFKFGRPCRICRASMDQIKTFFEEAPELIRNKTNYDKDVNLKNLSVTGVAEVCIFNSVQNYHVCDNPSLDFMHDGPEGAGNKTMVKIIHDFIYDLNVFTLDELNRAIQNFEDSNSHLISNKIPIIKKEHIKEKKRLKMSAAEMLLFIRCFGILVSDKLIKFVDSDDFSSDTSFTEDCNEIDNCFEKQKAKAIWSLYRTLRSLINLLTAPKYQEGHILILESRVTLFLKHYNSICGDLSFKFHNFTHITRVIRKNGPMITFQTARYESKHRPEKIAGTSTSCKKNVLKTICLRNQLQLAYLCFTENFCSSSTKYESGNKIDEGLRRIWFRDSGPEELIFSVHRAKHKAIVYVLNLILIVEIGDNDVLNFAKVKKIFIRKNEVFLVLQRYKTLRYDDNYNAFLLEQKESTL